ncbi:MAG TPA: inovirus Gp2 family protein [Marinobacter sp.]|uniref:Inovirus Gp2 family protein n=2 Tax=root TaxID=1 RepID=A0A831R0Z2_9GAMM|nr:inovirus-type Gp2 protein [Marinobacter antarcticus]HDZ38469.1 inovirus Gp2 family protein [Marinobacter sp.]HEA52016.1 inovirus Gp2 family protein [Marinobacter antarcticus]
MDSYAYHDTPTDEEMLDWLGRLHGGEIVTNSLGQPITMPSDYHWRNDLIWVDQQLKTLADAKPVLDYQRLIKPEAFGTETVVLAPDPVLGTLTTLFTVLVTMFHETEIGQLYRPSPFATRFLWAFDQCAYLREAGFHQPPSLSRQTAEQLVMDLNQRLEAWYQTLKGPDFTYECHRNRRNSLNNYQRLCEVMDALFDCHSRLMVIRVDLGYSEFESPYIDYQTARYHREQLCLAFNTHSLFNHLLGYAWKLEWQPKKGFHYHFIFFFDGHQCQEDVTHARLIGEMWATAITGGQGLYWNCNLDAEHHYHYNAMGRIDYHDFEKKRGLFKLAKYLTKIDEYAAMLVKGRTFQTSQKPERHDEPRRGRPRLYQSTHWAHGDTGP